MFTLSGAMDIELEGYVFTIKPEDYVDVMLAYRKARKALEDRGLAIVRIPQDDIKPPDDDASEEERAQYAERMAAMADAIEANSTLLLTAAFYILISRIESWKGPVLRDKVTPAPCTEENKLQFFGKKMLLANTLMEEIQKRESDEEKN